MKGYGRVGRIKMEKLGYSAGLLSLLLTLAFTMLLMQGSSLRWPSLSLQVSIQTFIPNQNFMEESTMSSRKQGNEIEVPKQIKVLKTSEGNRTARLSSTIEEILHENKQVGSKSNLIYVTQMANVKQGQNHKNESSLEQKHVIESSDQERNHTLGSHSQEENDTEKGEIGQTSSLICNFSEPRSDTCYMLGDVRVLSSSNTILLVTPSQPPSPLNNSSQSIKPYARKWELQSMQNIKELYLRTSSNQQQSPYCNLKHTVPGIIFSTGGFLGNFFHDFTDVIIPLFVTSRQYIGEVQFLVTDYNVRWITKYKPILQRLSRFDIINMDTDKNIHCFPSVHIGLKSHKVLGIDTSKTPKGYSMTDFKKFLRETFSLKRGSIMQMSSRRKPRLLMISREGSRSLLNEKEVTMMARRIGYKVIIARPKDMKELPQFAETVNSCDVMVGVHGAGLANMVFMPENSTVIQIIPWGGLTWACRHDYGEPAPDMGIKYLEYEITEYESSLIKEYPIDHAVFKDPLSIQRQGWNTLWSIFLNKQKIKLDVAKFKHLLLDVYRSLKQ